jgi:L-ascorbate metabolism protein UlaG (beta-lactamase superfamily)
MKIIFYIGLISNIFSMAIAQNKQDTKKPLTIQWTSIAGVLISDGVTNLGFDLIFTKPELKHWIFNAPLLPNDTLLEKKVQQFQIKKLDALFISHTHCDHAVDTPWFSAKFHTPIYGTVSIQRLAKGYEFITKKPVFLKDMVARQTITVGEFKITPFARTHAPIIQWLDWHFLVGDVPENTQLKFYDYYTGDTWSYLIEHPRGSIYVDQGGHPKKEILDSLPKIDVAVLGTANKKSLEDWITGYAKKIQPKVIMPVHYDWFFLSWPDDPFIMPRMQLEEIGVELSKLNIKFVKDKIVF